MSMAFFAIPYGAFVSSGYPSHSDSSRNGTGVNFGYEHTVPSSTVFSTPTARAASMVCVPIMRLSRYSCAGATWL